jgi:hypothetical protein
MTEGQLRLLLAGGGVMLAAGIYRFFVVRGQLDEQ